MSYIKFTYDVDENRWSMDSSIIQFDRNELHFCFVSSTERTRFKNLNFSYSIKNNDQVVGSGNYPPEGVEYQYADLGPLAVSSFSFSPDQKYYITVAASNSDRHREDTFEVVGIRPIKPPFDSWTWNGEKWTAPVPMPTDGFYEWHESLQKWNKRADLNAAPDVDRIRPDDPVA